MFAYFCFSPVARHICISDGFLTIGTSICSSICVNISLSTTLLYVYKISQLQAGLIYLLHVCGAVLPAVTLSKCIDRDYRVTAKRHGFSLDSKVFGNDPFYFLIEKAKMQSIFLPTIIALATIVTYGWLVDKKTVRSFPDSPSLPMLVSR